MVMSWEPKTISIEHHYCDVCKGIVGSERFYYQVVIEGKQIKGHKSCVENLYRESQVDE